MKRYIKIAVFLFVSAILFAFVLFVDTTFYRVPSFIRIFRYEREIVIAISFLFIFLVIREYLRRHEIELKQSLCILGVGIILLIVPLFFIQLFLRRYLILWDNNPFLAEYPFVWNTVSTLIAIFNVTILIVLLLDLRILVMYRRRRFSELNFRYLIFLILGVTVIMNIFEDRYSFQPLNIFLPRAEWYFWLIIIVLGMFFFINSLRTAWIDFLSKREKWIVFFVGLIVLPISICVCFSRLVTPVYAYSTTVKGFMISALGFIIIYTTFGFFGILFRLPTAAFYDRMAKEIVSFSNVCRMISSQLDEQHIIGSITRYALESTGSDACWLELVDEDSRKLTIVSAENLPDRMRRTVNLDIDSGLSGLVISNKTPLIIHDTFRDDRATYLKLMKIPWRSVMAVPLISNKRVRGILYAAKSETYAYSQDDLGTFETFLLQANIVLDNSRRVREALEQEEERLKQRDFSEMQQFLFPQKIPEVRCYQIEIISLPERKKRRNHFLILDRVNEHLIVVIAEFSKLSEQVLLHMSMLKGILISLIRVSRSPSEMLMKVDDILCSSMECKVGINLVTGLVDLQSGTIRFSRAGDCYAMYYRSLMREINSLRLKGSRVGLNKGIQFEKKFEELELPVYQDDIIIFYSISLADAADSNSEALIEKMLFKIVKENAQLESSQLKALIIKDINNLSRKLNLDLDIGMVILKCQIEHLKFRISSKLLLL